MAHMKVCILLVSLFAALYQAIPGMANKNMNWPFSINITNRWSKPGWQAHVLASGSEGSKRHGPGGGFGLGGGFGPPGGGFGPPGGGFGLGGPGIGLGRPPTFQLNLNVTDGDTCSLSGFPFAVDASNNTCLCCPFTRQYTCGTGNNLLAALSAPCP